MSCDHLDGLTLALAVAQDPHEGFVVRALRFLREVVDDRFSDPVVVGLEQVVGFAAARADEAFGEQIADRQLELTSEARSLTQDPLFDGARRHGNELEQVLVRRRELRDAHVDQVSSVNQGDFSLATAVPHQLAHEERTAFGFLADSTQGGIGQALLAQRRSKGRDFVVVERGDGDFLVVDRALSQRLQEAPEGTSIFQVGRAVGSHQQHRGSVGGTQELYDLICALGVAPLEVIDRDDQEVAIADARRSSFSARNAAIRRSPGSGASPPFWRGRVPTAGTCRRTPNTWAKLPTSRGRMAAASASGRRDQKAESWSMTPSKVL